MKNSWKSDEEPDEDEVIINAGDHEKHDQQLKELSDTKLGELGRETQAFMTAIVDEMVRRRPDLHEKAVALAADALKTNAEARKLRLRAEKTEDNWKVDSDEPKD